MFNLLFGITMMKSIRPIFRKNVMQSIDNYSFLLLNTIFISIFVVLYFYYLNYNNVNFSDILKNCGSMNIIQIIE